MVLGCQSPAGPGMQNFRVEMLGLPLLSGPPKLEVRKQGRS